MAALMATRSQGEVAMRFRMRTKPCSVKDIQGSGARAGGIVGYGDTWLMLVNQLVEDISLPRDPAQFADAGLDLFESEVMHGARRGDDVFLDHQRAHVIGAEEQSQLTDFLPLRDPR